jgi:quercetin dioxygenase-like cupin family protein
MTDDLAQRLRDQGFRPSAWSNQPGERYAFHDHPYDKVIAVQLGSIRFGLPGPAPAIDLVAGDRLDLPAGTSHDALVGPDGVACLEAHLPAGSLDDVAARRSGSW